MKLIFHEFEISAFTLKMDYEFFLNVSLDVLIYLFIEIFIV